MLWHRPMCHFRFLLVPRKKILLEWICQKIAPISKSNSLPVTCKKRFIPEVCLIFTRNSIISTILFHSPGSQCVQQGTMKIRGNCWYLQHGLHNAWIPNTSSVRYYSDAKVPESTKSKLKRAVKDYGATVIVFHVLISITSLSICYAAVARLFARFFILKISSVLKSYVF